MVMGKFGVIQKWCSILVRIHEILAGGGRVPRFWSTYIHTHDKLDKLRSALANAQLKRQISRIAYNQPTTYISVTYLLVGKVEPECHEFHLLLSKEPMQFFGMLTDIL